MLTFTGTLKKIGDIQKVSDKFQKREIVVSDNGAKYEQLIAFQFTQKNCDLVDGCNVGDEVEVTFGLKGREYNGKYFTNLDAFRIKVERKGSQIPAQNFQPDDDQSLPF